jgi:recombination protein RecA
MAKEKKTEQSLELDSAWQAAAKLYEKGGLVNLGSHPRYPQKVLTNRPSIDYVTDGGFPKGRMILIAGEPSSSKSSLTIQMVDLIADKILYIDTEATLTTDYLESLGTNPSKFYHSIPSSTEEMMNLVRREIPNFANNVIVIDSINNSASEEQIQKEAQERTMANRAIVMAAQLPIIIGLCNQYNVTLFILSQIRDNMNKKNPYSPETVIPGGRSMHHNSSMTLEMTAATKKKSKDSDELALYETITGRMVKISCTKNKVGKPFRTIEIEFTYGEGFTVEADTASAAIRLGVLQMAGSWVKYNGENICQGKDNILPLLKDNPDLLEQLQKKVKEKVLSGVEEAEDKEIETLN